MEKKRLEILNYHGFECDDCQTDETMLAVHHKYYEKGKLPWEYPDNCFAVLCETCHQDRHDKIDMIKYYAQLMYGEQLYYTVDIINSLSRMIPPDLNKVIQLCMDILNNNK